MSHLLARLRSAFTPAVQTPDVELLTRFLDRNDQDAFAELVRRYGPVVLGVCRRTLGDGPDAEDAYQAVFLVLAKRAATVRGIGRVGGWLHGVATLTAKKARARRAKRRQREQAGGLLADVPAIDNPVSADLTAVIDDELAAIPEKYRTAVVLCELRQLTLDQAAAELGVPRGTIASRLARGREALGKRLLRRGLFSVIPPVLSFESPPVDLTPAAESLSREVLRTMTVSKHRWLPLAVLPLIAVSAGLLAADPPKPTAPPPKAEEKQKRNATVERVKLVGIGGLLEQQAVRKEMRLTKEQQEKLTEAKAEVRKQLKVIQAATDRLRGKEDIAKYLNSNEQYTDVLAAHDLTVGKLLTPEQLYRLKQIQLQREGPTALLSRYAVRELGYTPEQEDNLAEAMKPLLKPKLMDVVPQALAVSDSPERGLIIQQLSATLDAVREDAIKCLTAEQKAKWKEMIGEEVATAILVVASPESFAWAAVMSGK